MNKQGGGGGAGGSQSPSSKKSPFKLSHAPNLLRNQHLQHFNMYKMIDARVKKDIGDLKDRSDDDDDLWELERQMQVFDKGETMWRDKTKKKKGPKLIELMLISNILIKIK